MVPLWDKLGKRRATPVTSTLVSLILTVFVAQIAMLVVAPDMASRWLGEYALVPVRWGQTWGTWEGWLPLFSSSLLHGGVAHVVGNAWFLWVFGRSLEEAIGSFQFLLIYLLGAVGAGLAQIASGPGSAVPMVGASGAISAVMGAYLVRLPTRWIISLVPWIVPILPVPAVVFLLLWFVIQFSQGLGTLGGQAGGGVAWWAHAGGFVVGAALAMMLPTKSVAGAKPRRRTRGRERE